MDDFYAAVWKMRNGNPRKTWEDIGDYFGETAEAVRCRFKRQRKTNDGGEEAPASIDKVDDVYYSADAAQVFFPNKKRVENVNWRELISLAQTSQDINLRLSDEQEIGEATIITDQPVAVMHGGDWHLGDTGSDYGTWVNDMTYLLETPNLYYIDHGDNTQNMRVFKDLAGVLNQVLSPMQQGQLFRSIVDELTDKNKLLAKVRGNHDLEFDERIFGEALQKYLLNRADAPMFNNKGLLKLTVGEQLYTFLLFHKSKFRSYARATHGNYRELQLSFPADVVAGAHDHAPAIEIIQYYTLAREAGYDFGGETFLIKIGSYQEGGYGWRYFHNGGICTPTVVLYPHEHKKVVFTNPRDAVVFANAAAK